MIPTNLNDRMLELAGGCRHEWGNFSDDGMTRYFCKRQGCGASHYGLKPPAVGDGHQMTLGEMVRLWTDLRGEHRPAACEIGRWPDGDNSRWVAMVTDGVVVRRSAFGDTPESALAAAILAAVDGEQV
jgi:hypothetical protein